MGDETMGPMFDPAETYTLSETGVMRGSDGAHIPEDESNADWRAFIAWEKEGGKLAPAPTPPFDPGAVAAECERRIYAVASLNCQMNMTAWVASRQADDVDRAAFDAALGWVQAMRAACARLVASSADDFGQDALWPACPADVAAFAARF